MAMASNNTTERSTAVLIDGKYTSPSGLVFTRTSDHTTNAGYYKHSLPLREAASLFTGEYSVWKSNIPQTNNEMLDIMDFAKDCEVAFETPTEVIYVKIEGSNGWLNALTTLGFELFDSDKLLKRSKFWRQTPINVKLYRCSVLHLPANYFFGKDNEAMLEQFSKDELERVLDGGLIMREYLRTQGLEQMDEESVFPDDDPIRAQAIAQRLTEAPMWNVRFWGVGHTGQHLKGNGYFMPDELFNRMYGKNVDVVVLKDSGKAEVTFNGGCYFQAEPQMAKWEVQMNNQTVINTWPLFPIADIKSWVRDYLTQAWKRVQNGEALEGAMNILNAEAALIEDGFYEDLLIIGERWNALEALASGLDINTMPDLLNTVFSTVTRRIWNPKTGAARPLVPCAWHMQMVSNSYAKACGWNVTVGEGTCRVVKDKGWFVLSDRDYIHNYVNFGGNDMDDFFDGFFRTIDGVRKIVLVRSPNSIGEYGIFDYVEGDPYPEWTRYNDEVISFPEVAGRGWPKQLTEALADGTVTYTGLPSTKVPSEDSKSVKTHYSLSSFVTKLAQRIGDRSNVGRVVNVEMIYTATFHKHVAVQLCSHEDKVDTFINNGPMEDRAALAAEAVERAVVLATAGKGVDKWLWESKNMDKLLPEGVERPELVDGPISRLVREVRNAVHEYVADPHTVTTCVSCLSLKREVGSQFLGGKVYLHGQKNAVLPEKVRQLGAWFLGDYGGDSFRAYDGWGALRILRDFRSELGRTMRANEEYANATIQQMAELGLWMSEAEIQEMRVMKPEQWKRIYLKVEADMWKLVNRTSDAKPGGDGRQLAIHDVVLAVARAAYDMPTFTKKQVKENIVTNKVIWPYYLEALRFYGQASDVLGERVESWELECVHCHRVMTANDPVGRQAYTRFDGMCKACRGLAEWTVTCIITGESRTLTKLGNVAVFYREGSISKKGWGLLISQALVNVAGYINW
jgi:hypothetical protein